MDEPRLQHPTSLVCRVHTRLCALPLAQMLEVLRPLPLETLPQAPPHVLGLARLRGQAVPVLDLAGLLGLERPTGERARRLVHLAVGRRRAALLVDEVLGLQTLEAAQQQALPPLLSESAAQLAVQTLARLDGELLLVLNAARLLPASLPQEQAPA